MNLGFSVSTTQAPCYSINPCLDSTASREVVVALNMIELKHIPKHLSSLLTSRQNKSTYAKGTGAPKPENLQQRLSAVSSLTPFEYTRSNYLSRKGKDRVISAEAVSSYASITSSSDSNKAQFLVHGLPGTILEEFRTPVSKQVNGRFRDIRMLYSQQLIKTIRKGKPDSGDVSMKLKYLGSSRETAEPYIIIQCDKEASKRAKKFFLQDHVQEELKDDFCVLVLGQGLLRLVAGDAIDVLTCSWPKETLCGMPIEIVRDGISSTATLGGLIMVETSEKCLYGLTAGHCLGRFGGSHPNISEMNEESDSDSDSDDSDVDSEIASSGLIESRPYSSPSESSEASDINSISDTRIIGKVSCHSFNIPTEGNYDWALIDLRSLQLEPNALVLNDLPQSGSHLEPKGVRKTITWILNSDHPRSTSKGVIVLTNHGPQSGVLTSNGSCLLMDLSSKFVETYDLTMSGASSKSPFNVVLMIVC